MGRYYNGDIEGKFWFAVQSSLAAERFGVPHTEPNCVNFYFGEDDLDGVNAEIKVIEDKLGDKKNKLDSFFSEAMSYSDKDIENLGVSAKDLEDYADLGLGIKIRDCIVSTGQCSFDADI